MRWVSPMPVEEGASSDVDSAGQGRMGRKGRDAEDELGHDGAVVAPGHHQADCDHRAPC